MFFVDREFGFPEPLSRAIQNCFRTTPEKLRELWPKLAKDRGQVKDSHYSSTRPLADAYAAYYLTANAMKLPLILEECRLLGVPVPKDGTCIDVGSGPGTTMAGLAWWQKHRENSWKLIQLEQSKHFNSLSQSLHSHLRSSLGKAPDCEWITENASQLPKQLKNSNASILCFSNSLAEFAGTLEEKEKFFTPLLKSMKRGWLIIIEPGGQASTREMLEWRAILSNNPDIKIWLPCLNTRACGALTNPQDWCHEEAACEFPSWHDSLGQSAGLKKQSLIFSYLVVSIGVDADQPNANAFRMVSQRMEQKGQVQCMFCTPSEGKQKLRVQHSKANSDTEQFFKIKRGDILPNLTWREKGDVDAFSTIPSPALDSNIFPIISD